MMRSAIGDEPGCMMGASFVVRTRKPACLEAGIVAVDVELAHLSDWSQADTTGLSGAPRADRHA